MERIEIQPRKRWKDKIAAQGLVYNETVLDNGQITNYWNESAMYALTMEEVTYLENVTEELDKMAFETALFLSEEQKKKDSPFQLNIPNFALEYATESLNRRDLGVYGRFDFVYRGGIAKMLEYNADTPTGLVEASIVQWNWLEETNPQHDQWNSIHERLIAQWAKIKMEYGKYGPLYFAHTGLDDSGEDLMTTSYLRDCAAQAGWDTLALEMSEIGFDTDINKFVDLNDVPMDNLFKLYPWEDMMNEPFGEKVADIKSRWIQPAWTMFLSTKVLGAAMWHLYPNHENLLASYVDSPREMTDFVRKPIHGREGDGIDIYINGQPAISSKHHRWGEEGYIYQDLYPLENFKGSDGSNNHAVLGSWVIDGESAGVGIRESDGLITDAYCRFVPNIIFQ